MLSEVKIYKLDKETNKLEHCKTISKEEVKILYDSALFYWFSWGSPNVDAMLSFSNKLLGHGVPS